MKTVVSQLNSDLTQLASPAALFFTLFNCFVLFFYSPQLQILSVSDVDELFVKELTHGVVQLYLFHYMSQ